MNGFVYCDKIRFFFYWINLLEEKKKNTNLVQMYKTTAFKSWLDSNNIGQDVYNMLQVPH